MAEIGHDAPSGAPPEASGRRTRDGARRSPRCWAIARSASRDGQPAQATSNWRSGAPRPIPILPRTTGCAFVRRRLIIDESLDKRLAGELVKRGRDAESHRSLGFTSMKDPEALAFLEGLPTSNWVLVTDDDWMSWEHGSILQAMSARLPRSRESVGTGVCLPRTCSFTTKRSSGTRCIDGCTSSRPKWTGRSSATALSHRRWTERTKYGTRPRG